jgi:hypothetical protein
VRCGTGLYRVGAGVGKSIVGSLRETGQVEPAGGGFRRENMKVNTLWSIID